MHVTFLPDLQRVSLSGNKMGSYNQTQVKKTWLTFCYFAIKFLGHILKLDLICKSGFTLMSLKAIRTGNHMLSSAIWNK